MIKSHYKLFFLSVLIFLCACAPKIDYAATYTAFWENLPTDTPFPTDTPTPMPSDTPSPTSTRTETPTPTQTPTETVTPTVALTARLIWPRAKFGPEHVSWRDGTCPQEGQKLSCVFEYRKDSSLNCYVGATCYDACGWFYSVNTIPPGVEEFSGPCW